MIIVIHFNKDINNNCDNNNVSICFNYIYICARVCVYYFYFELILSTNCIFRVTCMSPKKTETTFIRQNPVAWATYNYYTRDKTCRPKTQNVCTCDKSMLPPKTQKYYFWATWVVARAIGFCCPKTQKLNSDDINPSHG